MMSNAKKWIACLTAVLLVFQAAPALMDEGVYVSNVTEGSLAGFRDAMEIISENGAFMLEGESMVLTTNEDYTPVWSSSNTDAVTIAEGSSPAHSVTIRAMGIGEAVITAEEGGQSKTFSVTVLNPENYEGEEEKKPTEGEEQEEELDEEGNPIRKDKMLIVINGGTQTSPYTGEEQTFGEYEASSTSKAFDPEKIRLNREVAVTATDCGYYMLGLKEEDFGYEDQNIKAIFVINDGYLKITPAKVTVTPDDLTKTAGEEDPELTASVSGLIHEEDVVEYTLARDEGEDAGSYAIRASGEEVQGNYRIQYNEGLLTILAGEGNPRRVTITSNVNHEEPVLAGTEITLTAHPEGFEDVEYTLQWQRSLDRETWEDVPGANDTTFTFILDEETSQYRWRVVATEATE